MAEFKRQGGILTGREERYDFFEGEPRSVGGNVGNIGENGQRNTAQAGSSESVSIADRAEIQAWFQTC